MNFCSPTVAQKYPIYSSKANESRHIFHNNSEFDPKKGFKLFVINKVPGYIMCSTEAQSNFSYITTFYIST